MKLNGKKGKKIISIIAILFFVLSFIFLLFSTFAVKSDRALFGYRFYYISTPSMEPDIMRGSIIICEETDISNLKAGDVISFVSRDPEIKGMINTHNIDSIEYNGDIPVFTTKGTNNPVVDEYKVYSEDIKGVVVYDSLAAGRIFAFLSKRWVSFCLTVLPIAVIVLINFIDLIKVINFFPDDEKNGEKDNNSEKEEIKND